MSFLDNYLKEHKLAPIPKKSQEDLEKLEKFLDNRAAVKKSKLVTVITSRTFEDIITDYSSDLMNLMERFRLQISAVNLKSIGGILDSLRFVISMGTEVYQLVDAISDDIVLESMTEREKHNAKISFGKDLAYFVWKTIDPFHKKYRWIPFRNTIEKKLVMWVAGMGLNAASDFFTRDVEASSVGIKKRKTSDKRIIRKVLPEN